MRLAIFGVWLAASASACILKAEGFTGGDGTTKDDGGAADGGGSASSSSGSASSSSSGSNPTLNGDSGSEPEDPSRPNLLINGDFELGCAGWNVQFGFLAESSDSHGGTKSCKYCMDTNFESVLSRNSNVSGKSGATYVGDLWYRAASDVPAMKTAGYVGSSLALASPADAPPATDGPPIDGTWQHVTTLVSLEHADAPQIEVRFRLQQSGNPAAQGNVICVYVDDAALRIAK